MSPLMRVKYVVSINPESITPEGEESIEYVDLSSVIPELGIRRELVQVLKGDEAPSRARRVIGEGDVLVSMVRPHLRSFAYVEKVHDGFVASTGFAVLRHDATKIDPKYLFFLMCGNEFIQHAIKYSSGANYPAIKADDIANFSFLLPPLSVQKRIAAFLDEHAGRIDTLTSELKEFAETLKTQRKAIISECVTRGLPGERDREMRDSGIGWLGEIPVGWQKTRLKHVINQAISGGTPSTGKPEYYTDAPAGTPWVSISDMDEGGKVERTKKNITDLAISKCRISVIPEGTLLYSMYASVGFVSELGIDAATNQAIMALFVNGETSKDFVKYWLINLRKTLGAVTTSSTQDNLNANKVLNLDLLLPHLPEQQRIAAHLDEQCGRIDELLAEIGNQIDLLAAYRKSLISEAVTGKIEI